jgi:natural product biosynthesis luciferase-like monooxygenase protein/non-ribosomal peptide synthase protein (TIGR01720 family)
LQVLLGRYAGQQDIAIGTPIANRTRREIEKLIGFFLNMLVLRSHVRPEMSFRELLAEVRETTLNAYAHQDVPFERLVEELQPVRDMSREPLFQVMLVFQNLPEEEFRLSDLQLQSMNVVNETARFDLTFVVEQQAKQLVLSVEYATDLFEQKTIEALVQHLQQVFRSGVQNPEQKIAAIELLTGAERLQVVEHWNDTAAEYSREKNICILFTEQVMRVPGAVAVVYEDQQLSYRELNERANQLAHYLKSCGVGPESRVAICMERSLEMVVALLGILKAGGAYLPLDPDYPAERLTYMLEDAQASVLLTQLQASSRLSGFTGTVVRLDADWKKISQESIVNVDTHICPENLAYVIYTSGSTGKPKGVGVTHGNLTNFIAAIGTKIGNGSAGTWLAVTNLSFDISILEVLWTLTTGFETIIVQPRELFDRTVEPTQIVPEKHRQQKIDFSLFYFAADDGLVEDKYKLLMEGAKFADRNGFTAVWTPERHFHPFGGIYPNPAVTGAAVAVVTKSVQIRAGSVVLPLQNPLRVAEEWSVVDNLSGGRVGISFASGWQANDFVLAPENYQQRKQIMLDNIKVVRDLWRGESIPLRGGAGNELQVRIHPRPLQPELPYWLTAGGAPETFRLAGEIGANLLTHLLGQTIEELAEKLSIYREAWIRNGHRGIGHVTLMMHTFIGTDIQWVKEKVRKPFCNYLSQAADLRKSFLASLQKEEAERYGKEDIDALVAHAFDRYFETGGLLGTPESCQRTVDRLMQIGVDEVACLIDFGVDFESVMKSLEFVSALKTYGNAEKSEAQATGHLLPEKEAAVTHLQCTPAMAQLFAAHPATQRILASVQKLFVGGEMLPISVVRELHQVTGAKIYNMYGPTETTIWSAVYEVPEQVMDSVPIGKPIANTQMYVVNEEMQPVPVGAAGELYIGGDGLARGYLNRAELTAERFIPDPFSEIDTGGKRLYRTGDKVRWLRDGNLEFLGRLDYQVKIRGHRIELGEIETALQAHSRVGQAVVVVHEDEPGEKRLVAYVIVRNREAELKSSELREYLRGRLPEYMVPALYMQLKEMPLTPNGKLDRKHLPKPQPGEVADKYVAPVTQEEKILCDIWQKVLKVERVGIEDNFFELGGDSILAIQSISRANQSGLQLMPRHLFQHQTIARLSKVTSVGNLVRAEQEILSGAVPLMPIQQWFMDQRWDEPHHYNHAVLLESKEDLDSETLKKAVEALLVQHDALRVRFHRGPDGQWQQIYGQEEVARVFSVLDLSTVNAGEKERSLQNAANQLQASLDLEHGPLVRAAHIKMGEGIPSRWLMIVHHLVVDGISWRVLLEDLQIGYRQLQAGGSVHLPPKTSSVRSWAEALQVYANSAAVKEQAGYWIGQSGKTPLPRDFEGGTNTVADVEVFTIRMDEERTRALLQELPKVRRVPIQEALLFGLAKTLGEWSGQRKLVVEMEGHGREEIGANMDISRTVGWFTTRYPIVLPWNKHWGNNRQLAAIKEVVRSVPNAGIGYGVLRYLGQDAQLREALRDNAEICFNYLGQFDQMFDDKAIFTPAETPAGHMQSSLGTRVYLIEVVALVVQSRLQINWSFSRKTHTRETVRELAERFIEVLHDLTASSSTTGATFETTEVEGVSQEELSAVLDDVAHT